jgi:hypothetical protein
MISKNWKRESLSWLAGFLEGEGCFTTYIATDRGRKLPVIRIMGCNTDKDVIYRCQEIAGCGTIHSKKNSGHKDVYVWSLNKKYQVYALCVALFSMMGTRRKKRIGDLLRVFKGNTKYVRKFMAFGEEKTAREWANDSRCVVGRKTLNSRLFGYGWNPEQSITELIR